MSGPSRIVFRAARVVISDEVIVSGLALAFLGDAYLWRESAHCRGSWAALLFK
jgi:hypothetical protein